MTVRPGGVLCVLVCLGSPRGGWPLQASSAPGDLITTVPCWDSSPEFAVLKDRQQFSFDAAGGPVKSLSRPNWCLTMPGANVTAGLITLAPCSPSGGDPAQIWTTVPNVNDSKTGKPLCHESAFHAGCRTGLAALNGVGVCSNESPIHPARNGPVALVDSKKHDWRGGTCLDYDANSSTFRSTTLEGEPHMCLSWGAPVRPCDAPSPAAGYPLCDVSLPDAVRVADLITRLKPSQKPPLLLNTAPAVPSLWLPPMNWWEEALHGLTKGGANDPNGTSHSPVSFPDAITSAAAFNRSLFFGIGAAIGTEARVMDNIGTATGWTFWSAPHRQPLLVYSLLSLLLLLLLRLLLLLLFWDPNAWPV